MIYGYARQASIWPGERLMLHVSCGAGRFRFAFYRWTGKLVHMLTTSWKWGERAGAGSAAADWGWPAYGVDLPRDWPPGVYVVHLEERGAPEARIAMSDAAVLFVLRGDGASGLLYKIPLATYNAYNHAGGGCFYDRPPRSLDPPGARLSFLRPGVGIGGPTHGAADFYDASSPRQTFAHWDARFIAWLLDQGYAPAFCTDLDIHADPGLLERYRLMLSVGHDEYWSEPMRDGVEAFIRRGGNAAYFSANVCWWRIHLVDGNSAMVCHQGGPDGARDHWWAPTGVARPEDALSGASYRHGGGWWDGPREARGYSVQDAGHWVFEGTGLRKGERFGASTTPPLVGYECDGAPLDGFDEAAGTARLASGARDCGTPRNYRLLAACPLSEQWQERPCREAHASAGELHAATMGIVETGAEPAFAGEGSLPPAPPPETELVAGVMGVIPPSPGPGRTGTPPGDTAARAGAGTPARATGGVVFHAGTTDWAQVLSSGQDEHVDTITRNVINRLLATGRGTEPP